MDKLLDNKILEQVVDFFSDLKNPVEIIYFSSKNDCQYCDEIGSLLTEVSGLSDLIHLQIKDYEEHVEERNQFGVKAAPVFIIVSKQGNQVVDHGIRYYGLPSGHEFSSLINDIRLVSHGDSGLTPETRKFLADLKQPVHMQVFVTPTCPYCPQAVVLAHQMALESPLVTADMVEAMEFPELSAQFNVSGVPQTTINLGAGTVVGAVHEHQLIEKIQAALAI
ncbi:MAG: glutaredoxin-like protein [Chloroflexi bacterium]|nr:MAG: glutaredoxin-like protein [Chloroflexota bacterium]MBA4375678.1 glutaredoxin [Anaerolinea sp.]